MAPGEEITVEIERGKSLVILLQTIGETYEDGQVKVFFELNGQQRVVRVPNRLVTTAAAHERADEGNPNHIAAPMPSRPFFNCGACVNPGYRRCRGHGSFRGRHRSPHDGVQRCGVSM